MIAPTSRVLLFKAPTRLPALFSLRWQKALMVLLRAAHTTKTREKASSLCSAHTRARARRTKKSFLRPIAIIGSRLEPLWWPGTHYAAAAKCTLSAAYIEKVWSFVVAFGNSRVYAPKKVASRKEINCGSNLRYTLRLHSGRMHYSDTHTLFIGGRDCQTLVWMSHTFLCPCWIAQCKSDWVMERESVSRLKTISNIHISCIILWWSLVVAELILSGYSESSKINIAICKPNILYYFAIGYIGYYLKRYHIVTELFWSVCAGIPRCIATHCNIKK